MLEHDNHRKEGIREAAKKAGDIMQGLMEPWTVASDHSALLSAERKKVLDHLDQEEERLIDDIQQVYSTFKDNILVEIKLKMNKAIDELKVEIAKARKQADVAYNEAEFSRVTISSTLKYCQKILDSAQDAEKLQQFQDIKTRLEKLDIRKMETEVITPVFKQQPATLTIPDLTVKMVTEHDKERVTKSCVLERYLQPDIKEKPTLIRSYNRGSSYSYGLAVNDDWLITTGYFSNEVKVFDRSSGSVLFQVDQGQHNLQTPMGVTCSNKGDIFVTYRGIKGVVRYNSKGQVVKITRNVFSSSWSFITCHGDQLVVTDNESGRVFIADFDCNINKLISKESLGLNTFCPWSVCVDHKGHLVVGDYGQSRVHVIDYEQPAIVKTFSDKLGANPWGVCVDEWGHILVADNCNGQVMLMSGQLEHARVIIASGDVSIPIDLAVTGPGEVAVLECGTGNVKVFKYADI